MADGPTQPFSPSAVTQTQTGVPAAVSATIAQIIPGYEILGEIHRGGQGVVFLAFQKSTKRLVAIKIPRSAASAGPGELARFQSEVEILAQLKHPHIVTIYDSGIATDGSVYFVMDYIEGQPLDDLPLDTSAVETWGPFLRRFASICEAVGAAHERGIVHCDLKPGNILVDPEGQPRILDFGLATIAVRENQNADRRGFFGSLPWASPEQAAGQPLSFPTDVYSLGMILFRLLTGSFPFDATGEKSQVLDRIIHSQPVAPRMLNHRIDRDLDAILRKSLENDPARRYASATTLAEDLHRYLDGGPVEARSKSIVYRQARRLDRLLLRRPIVLQLLTVAALSLLSYWITPLLLSSWQEPDRLFRRLALKATERFAAPGDPLEGVRIIALRPETNIAAIAGTEKLDGVTSSNPKSWRRMHGRLMERLADVGPRVVAIDFYFQDESPFDGDFVNGVRALRARNIEVVVGVPSWKLSDADLPEISPVIFPEVHWGCLRVDFSNRAPWALELLLLREGREPRPSFALAAAAAFVEPFNELAPRMLSDEASCEVQFWKANPRTAQARQWSHNRLTFPITGTAGSRSPLLDSPGVIAGDQTPFYMIALPDDKTLQARTLEYGSVFSRPIDELRNILGNKLVLIGDQRRDGDFHPYPGRGKMAGSYGQAVGINSILNHHAFKIPSVWAAITGLAAAGCAGAILGRWRAKQGIQRLCVFLLLASLLIIVSISLCPLAGYLCNPTVWILAALGCCEWTAFWVRRRATRLITE